ncbi:MAG: hypothetical protein AB1585_11335 [Thermodesulfobacteriota bacterium]
MKTWFSKILGLDSKSKVTLIENLRTIYGQYQSLLKSRGKARDLLAQEKPGLYSDLSHYLESIIGSLNVISHQCSLDLVRLFQTLQTRLRSSSENQGHPFGTLSQNQPVEFGAGPFPAKSLTTISDLLSFSHELAVEAMFNLLDRFDPSWSKAPKVQTGLPINLHVIDLGGGLFSETGKKMVRKEELLSEPLLAMFKGMYFPGISWSGPIGVNLKGLMVIMAQSSSRPEEDFWDKTYALLTGEYMNYNSRLGYHYTSVDAFVGDNPENNHIRFMFKGGAADDVRRGRRARFIGTVLEKLGFEVVVQKDLVDGRYLCRHREATEKNLDLIGRLMGCSRQRDMVMNDEAVVSWHVDAFLSGNYGFDPNWGKKEAEVSLTR